MTGAIKEFGLTRVRDGCLLFPDEIEAFKREAHNIWVDRMKQGSQSAIEKMNIELADLKKSHARLLHKMEAEESYLRERIEYLESKEA